MRVLLGTSSISREAQRFADAQMAQLLASHVQFLIDEGYDTNGFTVIVVEPGDSLRTLDHQLENKFLVNHYSGKNHGDAGFVPCFETLEAHPTFYEMVFIEGDEGIAVLIPKDTGIDHELLALCALHAAPAI